MASIMRATTTTMMIARSIFVRPTPLTLPLTLRWRAPSAIRCASGGEEKKSPARLVEVQRLLYQAEERYKAAGGGVEPIPKITIDHVTVSYARSGGPGGQNVNKVNTKVDMRFNVKNAHWLSERVRERILQMESIELAGTRRRIGSIKMGRSLFLQRRPELKRATLKMLWLNYRKSLMLLLMYHRLLHKRLSKRLPSYRLLGSRNDWTRRKLIHKRNHYEDLEIVGTNL
ncbi:hypothetical protein ACJIZ3_004077 [Penstemon smallii]|uniref:Prokaryotic-type class I peptide chain release factors domain-containing protein n=1 Tax=Penstemon smallii TaxID=265156 RepID=A0ABD3S134_9LAMI